MARSARRRHMKHSDDAEGLIWLGMGVWVLLLLSVGWAMLK